MGSVLNYKPNLLVQICLVDAKNLDFSESVVKQNNFGRLQINPRL